jgi:hypothetical protein
LRPGVPTFKQVKCNYLPKTVPEFNLPRIIDMGLAEKIPDGITSPLKGRCNRTEKSAKKSVGRKKCRTQAERLTAAGASYYSLIAAMV